MSYPYTVLDLGTPIKGYFDSCAKACEELRTKAGSDPGKKRTADGFIATQIRTCIKNCQAEIDKQAKTYIEEEGEYADTITQVHAQPKALSAGLVQDAQDLNNNWDEEKFKAMNAKLTKLDQMKKLAHEHGNSLQNHQKFRGDTPWDDALGKKAVGADKEKELKTYFMAKRAPGIALTAGVKPVMIKIDEFVKRGEDCIKAAMALKTITASSIKELTAEADEFLRGAVKQEDDIRRFSEDLAQAVIALHKGQPDPATSLKSAEGKLTKADITIKNSKTYLKTLFVTANNFPIKLKHAGLDAASPVVTTLTKAHQTLKKADTHVDNAKKLRDQLTTMIAEKKKAH